MSEEPKPSRQHEPSSEGGGVEPLPYAHLTTPKLTTIRRLPAFEANLAAGKLEAEGIESFVADQNIANVHPLLFNEVRLQVREIDVERAEEILSKPSAADVDEVDDADADEDDVDDASDSDYVQEAFRCPKCHRKEVELVPFSQPTRVLRAICVLLLILPIVNALLGIGMTGVDFLAPFGVPDSVLGIVWVVAFCFIVGISIFPKRRKRCRQCGFEWMHDSSG